MKQLLILLMLLPLLMAFTPPSGPTDEGNKAFAKGDYAAALDAYKKAADDDPDKAEAHYNLGGAYYKKGQYDKALGEYQAAIKLEPKMADAHYNAGDALYKLGRYEDALAEYKQADAIRKGDKDTGHNIVVTMKRIKKKQEEEKARQEEQDKQDQQGKQGQKDKGKGGGTSGQDQTSRPQGGGAGGQGAGGGNNTQPQAGPQMSDKDVQALLNRQADEEKKLRNYFRPGRKDEGVDRESQIEQMLRGFGLKGPEARPARPGAPYVEKDW